MFILTLLKEICRFEIGCFLQSKWYLTVIKSHHKASSNRVQHTCTNTVTYPLVQVYSNYDEEVTINKHIHFTKVSGEPIIMNQTHISYE
jgi:hypothetical protein